MLYEITSRDVITKNCPIPNAFTGSSREQIEISEIAILFFAAMLHDLGFYRSLFPSFEIDLSSVHPRFVPMTSTSLIKEYYEEILSEETLEYDIIVRMPPRKRYAIGIEVKSIKKAEPRIVEPEWI
jgi:hypothetical protein